MPKGYGSGANKNQLFMGGDSCSKGFESQHRILGISFFAFICWKNCSVVWKDRKWIKERPRIAHFFKNWTRTFASYGPFICVPVSPEVSETRLRVHPDGCRRIRPREIHRCQLSLPLRYLTQIRRNSNFLKWHYFTVKRLSGDRCSGLGISVTRKKSPNVYKSCPKMISLEKW